jgi:hypothetical protein
MRSTRRAQLQRKLSMRAVPHPPAGLLERIKADIPDRLQSESERTHFAASIALSMRVAASIILLITSAFVTLHLLEPSASRQITRSLTGRQAVPAVMPISPKRGETTTAKGPEEIVHLEMSEEIPQPRANVVATPERRDDGAEEIAPANLRQKDLSKDRDSVGTLAMVGGSPATPPSPPPPSPEPSPSAPSPTMALPPARIAEAPASSTENEPLVLTAEVGGSATAKKTDEGREAKRSQAAGFEAAAAQQAARARMSASSSPVRYAFADELKLDARRSLFGFSVDPQSFNRIRTSLENGGRPASSIVNVEALVNYFAGPPTRPPRRGIRLDVEASPALVNPNGDHAILRFTVDAATMNVEDDAPPPPIAEDLRLEIDFDPEAVASFRPVGNGSAPGPSVVAVEPVLFYNATVTGLYVLDLHPPLRASQRIATVTLVYHSVGNDRERRIERVIHASDLSREWSRASRRHRLASLGALWGESLKGAASGSDVAKRAEELAAQNPKDSRARELAHAASVSGGG